MGEVRLRVDASSLSRSGMSGTISAGVWLESDDGAFPEQGWDDWALLVVSDLAAATRALTPGRHSRQNVRFFEGPHTVGLTLRPDATLDVTLTDGHRTGQSQTVHGRWPVWVASVETAGSELVSACTSGGWSEVEEVDQLRRQLAALTRGAWKSA